MSYCVCCGHDVCECPSEGEVALLRGLDSVCPDCGGLIRLRNPTGHCDHLHYPEYKVKE